MRTSISTLGPVIVSGLLLAAAARAQSPLATVEDTSNASTSGAPAHAGQAAGQHGAQGLIEVGSALLGKPGLLRLSVLGEHGWAEDYPDAIGDHRRTVGTFAASYVPLSWLELSLSWAAASNTNTGLSPSPINAMGDVTLGAKVSGALTPWLAGGLELTGLLFPGIVGDTQGPAAFGLAPRALLSADLHRLTGQLPVRAHLNLGGRFDSTGSLAGYGLSAAEELALSVNRYPRLTYGLGVEVPLAWVTPFAEHAMALPLEVDPAQTGSGLRHTLAAGVRVTAIRDLSLTLAGQLGLNRDVVPGVAATLPINLFFGASFNLDTFGGARASAPIVEVEPDPLPVVHRLSGVIRDHQTGQPVPGAVVTVVDSDAPPVATDAATGTFLTHAVPEGRVKISVEKDGYHALTAELPAHADAVPATLVLTPKVRPARLTIDVRGAEKPLAALLAISGTESRAVAIPASGSLPIELPAGTYTLEIQAEGHLAQVRDVQVSEGGTLPVRFELTETPKKALVIFKKDQLEILQQVRFGAGTASLHPDSVELLRQVVDAVIRNDVKRLRIEGHTDSSGKASVNLRLSKERAQSVADALVELGLDRARLDVEGYGSKRPLAPNVTARGRQLNRRVDFIVVGQER